MSLAQASSEASQLSRSVGTIKTLQANSITVHSDSGSDVTAAIVSSTRMLRVPPGETDLKKASPLTIQDLQEGDRVLLRGQNAADGRSMTAVSIIVMKQSDVTAKQERDRQDWQKRGVGGLVIAVDTTAGTVTVSAGGVGAKRDVLVHTTKNTVNRRYASNSVRFDDAQPAPLDQIQIGDQLRARGTRSSDGNEIAAEEIVSGTFRNIAGTVSAVDPASNSFTVEDVIGKNRVVVKLSSDSELKKLPPEIAQRIANRLKGSAMVMQGQSAAGTSAAEAQSPPAPGGGGSGAPDLQRFLSRLPNTAISDLQKGDAVMIVSTNGQDSGQVTAITMLAGVEPLLTAAPAARGAAMLSQWSLGNSGPEAEGGP